MSDLISRQAIMKEFADFVRKSNNSDFAQTPTWNDAVSLVGSMPSAQPEIIRCKDCKYSDTFPPDSDAEMPMKCLGIRYGGVYPDWYCEHAERREDE